MKKMNPRPNAVCRGVPRRSALAAPPPRPAGAGTYLPSDLGGPQESGISPLPMNFSGVQQSSGVLEAFLRSSLSLPTLHLQPVRLGLFHFLGPSLRTFLRCEGISSGVDYIANSDNFARCSHVFLTGSKRSCLCFSSLLERGSEG